jgi:uncharacterized protein
LKNQDQGVCKADYGHRCHGHGPLFYFYQGAENDIVSLTLFGLTNYFESLVTMELNLKRIPEGHSVLSQSVSLNDEQSEWLALSGDIACKAEIDRFTSQVYVLLSYNSIVEMHCSRCLVPVKVPLSGNFRIVLQKRTSSSDRNGIPEEDVDLFFSDSTDTIDLSPLIFDEIMVSLPMKPLCSAQCKGIVDGYGSAVNVEFEHNNNAVDPRWEALKKLKK